MPHGLTPSGRGTLPRSGKRWKYSRGLRPTRAPRLKNRSEHALPRTLIAEHAGTWRTF